MGLSYVLIHNTVSLGKDFGSKGNLALQTHSFKDAEPQTGIPQNVEKSHGISTKQLRPGIDISLTINDPGLPSTQWQSCVVCYPKCSQLGLRNVTRKPCS